MRKPLIMNGYMIGVECWALDFLEGTVRRIGEGFFPDEV